MDNRILSQNNTTRKDQNEALTPLVDFDISLTVSCPLGSLDDMATCLRDAVMPAIAGRLAEFAEATDRRLKNAPEIKADGYRVKESNVPRTYTTAVGEVSFSRTYFKDPSGHYVYLLDKILGIDPRERVSKGVSAAAINNAISTSYQKAIDQLGVNMSRQTLHNRISSLGELVVDVPKTKTPVKEIHIFADEDHVGVKTDGGKKNVMVPLIAITEGIDGSNPKRHKVKNPLYIAGYRQSPSAIYNQAYATADRRFDLDRAERIYIHGDGGSWIKAYRDVFPDAVFVMDEFHITSRFKELSSFFSKEDLAMLMKFIRENNRRAFYEKMAEAIKKEKPGKQAAKLREQLQYFVLNWDAIVRRKTLDVCGSCTEPMISHVFAERISRTPCCWSEAGLEKMAMLRAFKANGGVVKRNDINVSADKKAVQKGLKKRKEEGYDKYVKYAQESAEELEKRFRETFHNGLADYVIDVSGGVQQFIKRISSQELGS